jgi:radical SAM superfamily enzyme YgiQ (UPF0313 family)
MNLPRLSLGRPAGRRALLIYPEFPETFWSFGHALKFVGKRASLPPLGLLTVAALLPEDWQLRLVDLNVRRLTDADLAWADIALVSAMSVQSASALAVIDRCQVWRLPVVAGGPMFTNEPERFPQVDHLVLGEAEVTLPPFLAALARGEAPRVTRSPERADLGASPTPRWDLLDLKRYASMSIQYSRGCPFDCEFCNVTALFGHRMRLKSSAQILAELDGLYARGWRDSIFFVDDNLIGNKHALREDLLPALSGWRRGKPRPRFYTQVSINLADDAALLAAMEAAGFDRVFIGIETPEESSLNECSKRQNLGRDLVASVQRIQRAGMEVQGGFIVGFDSDPPSVFQRQIDFIQKSGIVTAMVGLLQAPAGTRLYARMKREGRLTGSISGDNADGSTNIVPRMNPQLLQEGYRSILRNIYAPRPYYARIRTLLREHRSHQRPRRLHWGDLRAFGESLVRLGILGRERGQYWQLLGWTLCHDARKLPLAVTLAVTGHHLRRVCELQLL